MTSSRRARLSSTATAEIIDIKKLSDGQIGSLMVSLREEISSRAFGSGDPEVMGSEFLRESAGLVPEMPVALNNNIVAVGGLIKYNSSATRHTCTLYTIVAPGIEPFWAWEDEGTLLWSESPRVGDIKQSVALHAAVDGMRFTRHTMKWDGERHTRLSEESFDCVWSEDGKLRIVRAANAPRGLPIPNH